MDIGKKLKINWSLNFLIYVLCKPNEINVYIFSFFSIFFFFLPYRHTPQIDNNLEVYAFCS